MHAPCPVVLPPPPPHDVPLKIGCGASAKYSLKASSSCSPSPPAPSPPPSFQYSRPPPPLLSPPSLTASYDVPLKMGCGASAKHSLKGTTVALAPPLSPFPSHSEVYVLVALPPQPFAHRLVRCALEDGLRCICKVFLEGEQQLHSLTAALLVSSRGEALPPGQGRSGKRGQGVSRGEGGVAVPFEHPPLTLSTPPIFPAPSPPHTLPHLDSTCSSQKCAAVSQV